MGSQARRGVDAIYDIIVLPPLNLKCFNLRMEVESSKCWQSNASEGEEKGAFFWRESHGFHLDWSALILEETWRRFSMNLI